jgi:glycosyltransferase involved in cell wall biosynthesis
MIRPAATIVLPLLRQDPAYLAVALRTALDQSVPGEVIVVTSPQTPAPERAALAAAAAGPHGDRLRVVERTRPGFASALNHGIEAATADRVGILLTDDWLEPTALEESLVHDADIVSGGKTIWNAAGTERLPMPGLRTRAVYDTLTTDRERAAHLTHFLLFRRSSVLVVGGVDESIGDLAGVDDFDLPWSLLERGASVAFVGRSLYHMRDHAGERLTMRSKEARLAALDRILRKHGIPPEERAAIRDEYGAWYGRTLLDAWEALG